MTHSFSRRRCAGQPLQRTARAHRAVRWFAAVGFTLALSSALSTLSASSATAAGLNDTGQTLCYNAADVGVPCSAAVGGDGGVNPRQDGRYGRDAAAIAGQLTKIGAGSAGFDYTKIANNGSTLPATATLGTGPTDWACTKDNVTGLIWEVKTTSGLRSSAHTYTWYSTDATSNGGVAGAVGTNTCGASLAAAPYNNQCNTQNFVLAVNAAGLCGAANWRLPTRRELLTLTNVAISPSIDSVFFPNSANLRFWARNTVIARPSFAWGTYEGGTANGTNDKTSISNTVRLVR